MHALFVRRFVKDIHRSRRYLTDVTIFRKLKMTDTLELFGIGRTLISVEIVWSAAESQLGRRFG